MKARNGVLSVLFCNVVVVEEYEGKLVHVPSSVTLRGSLDPTWTIVMLTPYNANSNTNEYVSYSFFL
jgi:hypothetical protein